MQLVCKLSVWYCTLAIFDVVVDVVPVMLCLAVVAVVTALTY